jgi:hypothetical protein
MEAVAGTTFAGPPLREEDIMTIRAAAADAATGVVAGYAGTKAMEPVSMFLYRHEPDEARRKEDAVRPGPPYRIAAAKITSLLGLHLSEESLDTAGLGLHYGLAVSWAPLYGVLRHRARFGVPKAALGTGLAMSLIADEGLTPLLGFSAPNRAYPLVTHLRGVAAHLVFGAAVAAVSEVTWAIARRTTNLPVARRLAGTPGAAR